MKKLFALLVLSFALQSVVAQSAIEELKNSNERAKGGSTCDIQYLVHLTPTHVKAYYLKNFDQGKLVELNGKPLYYELSKKVGEEMQTVIINIESAALIELEVFYVKGNCNYKFEFYY